MTIDLHSLAAPYALHSLDRLDTERFENHLDHCESCTDEVSGFIATAVLLAQGESRTPPSTLRRRVLDIAASTPQMRPVVSGLAPRRRLRRTLPRLAVAAAFLVGAVGIGGFAAERSHAQNNQAIATSMSSVLAAPDASTKARAFSGGGNIRLVASAARDVAVIAANDLPALAKGKVYQVWMIKDSAALSQGTFETGGTMIMRSLKKADHVAVTVEPRGGSSEPSSAPIITFGI